jgi:hypothetical protein
MHTVFRPFDDADPARAPDRCPRGRARFLVDVTGPARWAWSDVKHLHKRPQGRTDCAVCQHH